MNSGFMKENIVKILISILVIIMMVYHLYMGHLLVSSICVLHFFCCCAVLYAFYKNHPIQKKLAQFWIGITFLFPIVVILLHFYQILFGNKKPWQYDGDSWASIFIMSIPLSIGIIAMILASKYLKEKRVKLG